MMKFREHGVSQNFWQRIIFIFLLLLLTACETKTVPTKTPTVTAVNEAAIAETAILKELSICMLTEPDDLFLYGSTQLTAVAVRHALYENLITTLDYGYQAQGLEKLPNLDDGDAVVNQVTVQLGDTVVDADGQVKMLAPGTTLLDAEGVPFVFNGEPVELPQMVVDFRLKPMVWSDGTAVTAADSVFSYEVAAYYDAASQPITHTASYTAVNNHTVRWTGLPGWLDQTYFRNVWTPLPQHQLANREMAELTGLFGPNPETPILSSGPFALKEWIPGANILLEVNPYYYRRSEQLPHLSQIQVLFGAYNIAHLFTGMCDVLTRDLLSVGEVPFLQEAETMGMATPYYQQDIVFEHIPFGINSYGGYGDGNGRPDWFEDVRVRQAIAHCTNRQRMVDEILFGQSEVMHTYVSSTHPLYPEDIPRWAYDVAAANALLDEAGYLDTDGDGIREDPTTGTPFHVELGTTANNEMRQQLAQIFKENQLECGIDVELYHLPASEWFAVGPDGKLFGRHFDLAELAWQSDSEPPCAHWLSQNIPGSVEGGWGSWDSSNITGWRDAAFDAACRQAQRAFRNSLEYITAHQEAMRLFAQQLPIVPLFPRVKGAATRPHVRNFNLNPTQPSELWNVHELDIELTADQITQATIPPAAFCAEVTEISQIECEALVTLYQQLGSRDWWGYSDWLSTPTPCSWRYVVCAGNRVVELEVYSSGSGTLPSELGDFAYLQSLKLSWQGFRTLPSEIGNLTNLSNLVLSGGNLSSLPPEIGNLMNLRHLALTGNNLTTLPPEFYNLVNLITLDLSGNKLNSFSPEITNLVNLETLDLSSNGLSSPPPEVFSLTSLTELDLQYNKISNLPSEIGNLTNLVKLDLYWNELSDLPPELWNLTYLADLSLSSNNLSYIAPEIGNLTNLNTLWLSYNNLTSLPPEIWNLNSLQYLHLSSNQLSTLPAEIGNLTNMYWLSLDDNNLSKLPPEIGNLTRLEHVYLDNNNLRDLPPEIGNLTNLTFLYLRQNNLNSLPREIGNLVNLYALNLEGNNLSDVPLEVTDMTYLHSLDLRENPLVTLPPELCAAFPETLRVEPRSLCNR